MSRNLLSLLLIAAIGLAKADEPEKIVSGTNTQIGEFPFVVSLRMNSQHFCGGAIIGPRHILTAAHCLYPFQSQINEITVVTGSNFLDRGGQAYRVIGLFTHPLYGGPTGYNWFNDVGVVKLASPIAFNAFQNKINLPSGNPQTYVQALVVAWGMTAAPPRGALSNSMQKLALNIIPREECQRYHQVAIQDSMICTLNQVNVGTCSGDSGSPLVYRNEIIGVVSGGIPCARGIPDVFTNIYSVLPFVRQAMNY